MVLFGGDFERQGAIRDYSTRNDSFIKTAFLLRELGVENWDFCLALFDKDLVGINPHDPDLSEAMIVKIGIECKRNYWYFLREVVRIEESGGDPIPFQAHRANIAQMWLALLDINQLDIMARQVGKTIGALCMTVWYMYFLNRKLDIGHHAKDRDLIGKNVQRVKGIRDALPAGLIKTGSKHTDNNKEGIIYTPMDGVTCEYMTYVANASPKQATKHGRGGTYALFHYDEPAYSDNIDVSYDAARPACSTAFDAVRKNGLPASIIMTTTPGYTMTPSGEYVYSMRMKSVKFTEAFYDFKDKAELHEIVEKNSQNGFVLVEYPYGLVGKTKEWAADAKKSMSLESYLIDIDLVWMHGANSSVFTKDRLVQIKENVKDPKHVEVIDGLLLNWYIPESELRLLANTPLLLGSDTSDNCGRDNTTLILVDPSSLEVIMTAKCNESNMVYVANVIYDLLSRFNRSIFIPEQNRASTLLDLLILKMKDSGMNPFTRIFNRFVDERGDITGHDLALGSVRKMFGFYTGKGARTKLYSEVLDAAVSVGGEKVNDLGLYEELAGLMVRKGRIDHPPGGHDDMVIAYLLTAWFAMFAKNLHLYGWSSGDILSATKEEDTTTKVAPEVLEKYNWLKDKLANPDLTPSLKNVYEYELSIVAPMIERDSSINKDVISIHQEIDELRRERMEDDLVKKLGSLLGCLR